MSAYTTVDLSAGIKNDNWSLEVFARNLFDKRGAVGRTVQCGEPVCGDPDGETAIGGKFYTYRPQPRTIGLKIGRSEEHTSELTSLLRTSYAVSYLKQKTKN